MTIMYLYHHSEGMRDDEASILHINSLLLNKIYYLNEAKTVDEMLEILQKLHPLDSVLWHQWYLPAERGNVAGVVLQKKKKKVL